MVEIYNENVRDLLSAHSKNPPSLDIRQGERGVYIEGAKSVAVETVEDVKKIMRSGQRNRSVGSTKMNATSSRSHSLLLISVHTHDHSTQEKSEGRLILVRE